MSDTIDVTINVTDVDDSAVTPTDPVQRYAGENGTIEIDELFEAIDHFFDVDIDLSIEDLFEVIDAFFATNG